MPTTRARYELYRRLLPCKFKYGLENPEKVFEFLEERAVAESRKAAEAEGRLQGILGDPATIFYEIAGTDLAAPEYYEALKKEGHKKGFLDFVSEIIAQHFQERGLELEFREKQS